jgi:CBS domain containing-hemolysin-like protein
LQSSPVPLVSLWPSVAAVLGCIVVGALFAMTDAALTALPESRLHALLDAGEANHAALRRFAAERSKVLARLLVGRVVCTMGAAVIAAEALSDRFRYGGLLAFALVGLGYTVLAEIATSLARARATTAAGTLLGIVRPLELAMIPLAAPLAWIGGRFGDEGRTSRPSDPEETARMSEIAEREVEYLIEQGQRAGTLGHADLLQAAVDFKGTVAAEVMVPRTRMVAIALHTPLPRVLELITAEGHSRYPVYDGRIDEVVGLLYVKDLFRVVRENGLESTSLAQLIRKPVLFVQERQEVSTILREMRQRRLHMAIVLDEYGGTAGLVTLEDILELLVGDIQDELDEEEKVQDLGNGRLLVDAALSVDELSSRLGVAFPEGSGFVSVGGLVMEQLGKVPEAGTVVHVGGVDLVVRDADERRVRRIEVVSRPSLPA